MEEIVSCNKTQSKKLFLGKKKEEWVRIGFLISMFIVPVLNFLIFYVYVNLQI